MCDTALLARLSDQSAAVRPAATQVSWGAANGDDPAEWQQDGIDQRNAAIDELFGTMWDAPNVDR